jgi:hypothetical protein
MIWLGGGVVDCLGLRHWRPEAPTHAGNGTTPRIAAIAAAALERAGPGQNRMEVARAT